MKKGIASIAVLFLLTSFVISGCGQKLKQENEDLKKQVEAVTGEKASAESKVGELTAKVDELTKANTELTTKVDELTKANEELQKKGGKKKK